MNDEENKWKSENELENDVCFILTSAFLIFTMQTGYALLESGIVSRKNEINILLKCAVNIICGTCSFWFYGFALSSSHDSHSPIPSELVGQSHNHRNQDHHRPSNNSKIAQFFFTHVFNPQKFFVNLPENKIDLTYVEFAFQLAYATTCTAIISGAMAERCRFISYFLFSFLNGFLFYLPTRWINPPGWLNQKGVIDIGGSGTVHLV